MGRGEKRSQSHAQRDVENLRGASGVSRDRNLNQPRHIRCETVPIAVSEIPVPRIDNFRLNGGIGELPADRFRNRRRFLVAVAQGVADRQPLSAGQKQDIGMGRPDCCGDLRFHTQRRQPLFFRPYAPHDRRRGDQSDDTLHIFLVPVELICGNINPCNCGSKLFPEKQDGCVTGARSADCRCGRLHLETRFSAR